uniref:Pectinesterase inhibitor domain-containing protein n=1 Tax=Oryza punctata TaxID=4537 RepID=A0A0E0MC33_ORYPU
MLQIRRGFTIASSYGIVNALFLLLVVLVMASQAQLVASTDSFMDGACKTITRGGGSVISVKFCIDALGSDGRSLNASCYSDLTIVAIDLLTSNATSTKAKIDSILKDDGGGGLKPSDATMACLQSCQAA